MGIIQKQRKTKIHDLFRVYFLEYWLCTHKQPPWLNLNQP